MPTEDLIGTIIPNIYIKKISLLNSGLPLDEMDPHIDHEREVGVKKDAFGRMKWDPMSPDLSQKSNNRPMKITIDLIIKESLNNGIIATWFGNQDFLKFLRIKVSQSRDPVSTDAILANSGNFTSAKKLPGVTNRFLSVQDKLSSGNNLNQHISYIDNDGNKIHDILFSVSFVIPTSNPKHLAYFATSYLDVDSMIKEFQMDSALSNTIKLEGRLASESVINDFSIASESFAFIDGTGGIYIGPVKQTESGDWISSEDERTLELKTITNNKIQDFRDIENVKQLRINFSAARNIHNEFAGAGFVNKGYNIKTVKKSTYFTEIQLAQDIEGNARFLFGLDFLRLIRENTIFNSIYREDNLELLKNVKIRSMTIKRVRAKNTPDMSIKDEHNSTRFTDDEMEYPVVMSGEITPGNFRAHNDKKGSLRELKIFLEDDPGNKIRFFTGIDKTMSGITYGKYHYGVEIELEDNTSNYLEKQYDSLIWARNILERYYREGEKPGNFDIMSNRFTQQFINSQEEKYSNDSIEATIAPWIGPISVYMEVLSILDNTVALPSYTRSFQSYIHPRFGSLESVKTVIDMIELLASNIYKTVLSTSTNKPQRGPSSGRSTDLSSSVFKKGSTPRRVFSVKRYFADFFDSDVPLDIGYDFLSSEELEIEKNNDGLKVVTSLQYKKRTEKETLKYFKSTEENVNISTDVKNYTIDDAMDTTRYSYLTPSVIRLGKENTNPILNRGSKMASEAFLSSLETGISRINLLRNSPQVPYFPKASVIKGANSNDTEEKTTYSNLVSSLWSNGAFRGTIADPKAKTEDVLVSSRTVLGEQTNFAKQGMIGREISGGSSEDTEKRTSIHSIRLFSELSKDETKFGDNTPISIKEVDRDSIFDLKNPNNGLEKTLASVSKQLINSGKGAKTRLYDNEKKDEPYMKNIAVKAFSHPVIENAIKQLPNQLKSIFANSTNDIWDSVNKNKNNSVFDMNYNIINKIEVMVGFEVTLDGRQIKESIWEPLSIEKINIAVSENKNLLCRMIPYENQDLGIHRPSGLELPVYNRCFIISPEEKIVDGGPSDFEKIALDAFKKNLMNPTATVLDDGPTDFEKMALDAFNKNLLNPTATVIKDEPTDFEKMAVDAFNKNLLNPKATVIHDEPTDFEKMAVDVFERNLADPSAARTKISSVALEAFNASELSKTSLNPEYAASIISTDKGQAMTNLIGARKITPDATEKIVKTEPTTVKKYITPVAESALVNVFKTSLMSSVFKKKIG